jgi:hypothetical protein
LRELLWGEAASEDSQEDKEEVWSNQEQAEEEAAGRQTDFEKHQLCYSLKVESPGFLHQNDQPGDEDHLQNPGVLVVVVVNAGCHRVDGQGLSIVGLR